MERRSEWTGQPGETLVEVRLPALSRTGARVGERMYLVEPEHEAELRRFIGFAARYGRTERVVYLACAVLAVVGVLTAPAHPAGRWLAFGALLIVGASLLVFPFSTPETVASLGLRRSRRRVRWTGAALILLGVALLGISATTGAIRP